MTDQSEFGYRGETKSSDEEISHRQVLYELFQNRPIPDDQLMIVLGLYMRSSALAKILFLNELFDMIIDVPGVIVEFGTWWGQNMALFENLRAIHEPFNQSRRIIGFDTFSGYPEISEADRASETIKAGGYNVTKNYREYLDQIIDYHEKNNVLANVKKHKLIEGDVTETAPRFFAENPETVVALAYFDMALYEPTKVALEAVLPHMVPGSVVMLDELNSVDYPGETIAFREVFGRDGYSIRRSRFIADRTFVILK